jgi:hypothetical protein
MRLIRETTKDCDLTERFLRHLHQLTGAADAAFKQIRIRWQTEATLERGRESDPLKTDEIGQVGDTQRLVEMFLDVAAHPQRLPRGQSRPTPVRGMSRIVFVIITPLTIAPVPHWCAPVLR